MHLNLLISAGLLFLTLISADARPAPRWSVGTPIVTYWAGPPMTDRVATQMAEGGFNLVWCTEKDLDVAARHGLRAQLQDPLLAPSSLENPEQLRKLDDLVARVRGHRALYSYFITDEPNATNFPALGKLVSYLRQRDPSHLAYINLFPTYASNAQLGNSGDKVTAYKAHLRQYCDIVRPDLISYDHYQFTIQGDTPDYFLNLSLVREAAREFRVPFLNIVQACTWSPSMRVPNTNEVRYLVSTTLAYGAQGISYYVYCWPGHTGGIANADGTPTPIYDALQNLNREFVAIAAQLQKLESQQVYHAGMVPLPPGAQALPENSDLRFVPPLPKRAFSPPKPVKGFLVGYFGPPAKADRSVTPTHAVLVNLDYESGATVGIVGPKKLQVFNAATSKWTRSREKQTQLTFPPGGVLLLRIR